MSPAADVVVALDAFLGPMNRHRGGEAITRDGWWAGMFANNSVRQTSGRKRETAHARRSGRQAGIDSEAEGLMKRLR